MQMLMQRKARVTGQASPDASLHLRPDYGQPEMHLFFFCSTGSFTLCSLSVCLLPKTKPKCLRGSKTESSLSSQHQRRHIHNRPFILGTLHMEVSKTSCQHRKASYALDHTDYASKYNSLSHPLPNPKLSDHLHFPCSPTSLSAAGSAETSDAQRFACAKSSLQQLHCQRQNCSALW